MEKSWQFYASTPDAWEAMLIECNKAEASIYFEQYCFMNVEEGSIGRRFIDLFIHKAKQGIKVRMLIEAQASFEFYASSLVRELEDAGAEIVFHTISKHQLPYFFRAFFRDHRKIVVVDRKVGFVGGVIVKDKARVWRDTMVKLNESVALGLAKFFDDAWKGLKERNKFVVSPPVSAGEFTLQGSGPRPRDRFILREVVKAIRSAKKFIYITSPYFNPPSNVSRALRGARKRGVEIHMLLPEQSDNMLADVVSESYYKNILSLGIHIYLYDAYVHAKTVTIDNEWSTVGSANFDRLSLLYDYEANLVATNPKFAEELVDQFNLDLRHARELTLPEWNKRSFFRKFLEIISWPFRLIV